MQNIYLGIFKDRDHIIDEFKINDPFDLIFGSEILIAHYNYEDYYGRAFVLFKRNDQLFEVNASHCSCYGLEGQWEPELTSVAALRHRVINGNSFEGFKETMQQLLVQLY